MVWCIKYIVLCLNHTRLCINCTVLKLQAGGMVVYIKQVHNLWHWHTAQFTVCGIDTQHSSQCVVLTHSTVHSVWYRRRAQFTVCGTDAQHSAWYWRAAQFTVCGTDAQHSSQCVVLTHSTVHSVWYWRTAQFTVWYWCPAQFTVCGTDAQHSSQHVVLTHSTFHTGTPTNTQWHHAVSQTGHSCAAIRPITQHVGSTRSYAPDPSNSHVQLHTDAAGACANKPYSV